MRLFISIGLLASIAVPCTASKESYRKATSADVLGPAGEPARLYGWKVGTSEKLICKDPLVYVELKGIVCDGY